MEATMRASTAHGPQTTPLERLGFVGEGDHAEILATEAWC
jgi:hypothetical protein